MKGNPHTQLCNGNYTVGSDLSDIYLSGNMIYPTEDWGMKSAAYYCIRRHGSDVYLGMCPIKMATPILMYYGASAKLAKRRRRRTIEGYG